jgi:hypothetical protein
LLHPGGRGLKEKKLRLLGDLVVAKAKKGFQIIKKVEFLDNFFCDAL